MAFKVFKVEIFKSFGGRSNRGNWSNTHFLNTENDLNSEEIRADVAFLVAAEQRAHFDAVHFMRAHVTQVSIFGLAPVDDNFVTINLGQKGLRVAIQEFLLPREVVLEISRECETGRSGSMSYRGCLASNDVESTEDNSYELTLPEVFYGPPGNLMTICSALDVGPPNSQLCMPEKKGLIFKSYRLIKEYRLVGVGIRQATRRTTSIKQDEAALAQRKLNEQSNALQDFLQGRGLNAAELLEDLGTVNSIIQTCLDIYMALSPLTRAKVLWPLAVKVLIKALPPGPV